MNTTSFVRLAALAAAATLTLSAAQASLYSFDYQSADGALSASGEITVNTSGEVTGISGTISGLVDETIGGVVANPNYPSYAYSPDGLFLYDNAFSSSGQPFDDDGLLFTTEGVNGYWNLWGNGPDLSLWASGSGNYRISTSGTMALAAIPELPTWAMLGMGFAGLGYAALRRPGRRDALV